MKFDCPHCAERKSYNSGAGAESLPLPRPFTASVEDAMQNDSTAQIRVEEIAVEMIRAGALQLRDDGTIWRVYKKTKSGIIMELSSPQRIGKATRIGYEQIGVQVDGRSRIAYTHRVVWVYHFGPIPADMEINHKDRDKLNNRIGNLELVTHAENSRHWRRTPNVS